jgi:hypothetical protein
MQGAPLLSCWQCGTVLSAAGGRCPACGAEQRAAGSPPAGASLAAPVGIAAPRVSRRGPPPGATSRQKALPWVVLGVGLLAIGGLFALAPRHPDTNSIAASNTAKVLPSATQAPPVDPNDLGIKDPSAVDPGEILGRAKTRALAWSKDAQLVSLRALPVENAKVNLSSGGIIEFWFAKPTGEGFGSGARVGGKRLHLKLGATGTEVEEIAAQNGRAALEPNCPFDEAVRKAIASGIPATSSLTVSYEVNDKHKKPVWRLSAGAGDANSRTIDGWSCAILVR